MNSKSQLEKNEVLMKNNCSQKHPGILTMMVKILKLTHILANQQLKQIMILNFRI